MALDPDSSLDFWATILTGKGEPWKAERVERLLDSLGEIGIEPEGDRPVDAARWAKEADGKHRRSLAGRTGAHGLILQRKGEWVFSTPAPTLMETRHQNRPEAVREHVAAIRALLPVATPYFGMDRYSTQMVPYWLKPSQPFRAQRCGPTTFFSAEYLGTHHDGRPFPRPPVDSDERVAGGQLLVTDVRYFGEVTDLSDTLDQWLLKLQPC